MPDIDFKVNDLVQYKPMRINCHVIHITPQPAGLPATERIIYIMQTRGLKFVIPIPEPLAGTLLRRLR